MDPESPKQLGNGFAREPETETEPERRKTAGPPPSSERQRPDQGRAEPRPEFSFHRALSGESVSGCATMSSSKREEKKKDKMKKKVSESPLLSLEPSSSSMKDQKRFIPESEVRSLSIRLAQKIVADDWCPDIIVAVKRGGYSLGLYLQEIVQFKAGDKIPLVDVQTASRDSEGEATEKFIKVRGMDENLPYETGLVNARILIVDDVWDSGRTPRAVYENLLSVLRDRLRNANFMGQIRFAMPFFKPQRNTWKHRRPEYFCETTDSWLVFSHELGGLSHEEILKFHPDLAWLIPVPLREEKGGK